MAAYRCFGPLTDAQQGTLDLSDPEHPQITTGTSTQTQDWTLDATGNVGTFDDTTGGTTTSQTGNVTAANEIQSITGDAGRVTPTYDLAGNMIYGP
jgi:hypothetical protein